MITETDIFRAFVEMMGSGQPGLRLLLRVPGGKGTLAKLATAIADLGGNILSVGTFAVDEEGQASSGREGRRRESDATGGYARGAGRSRRRCT